jgi:hypothetical protein
MGLGEHLARLDSFRARGSASCGRSRYHTESVDGHPALWTGSEPIGDLGSDSWLALIHVADRDHRDYVGHVDGRMERLRSTSYPRPVDRRARARDFYPARLNPLLALIPKLGFKQMLALSLDMGGTHIGCGVVRDNELLGSASLDSGLARSLESLLPCVTEALRTLLKESVATADECNGIAIGFPGIVDVRNGRILSTLKKYEDAIHLDLGQWAIEQFGLGLRIENDARMALLGEQYAGSAQGVQDVVMITLAPESAAPQ